ncbi:MAG: DUF1027 domain-containing protein [Acholeplasmatales bacterium]|nr:DUF1027 domain-containing protein [Acholeplasmatales bacterium]
MVVKTTKGCYEILKNVRNAFVQEAFEQYYIEEIFDSYPYVVIDFADEKPRVKGFDDKPTSPSYFHYIMDYLQESCNFLAPYAILRRIDEEYYNQHKADKENESITKEFATIPSMAKENFDKDSLILEQSSPSKVNVKFDPMKYNSIGLYDLPMDIVSEIEKDRAQESRMNRNKRAKKTGNFNGNKTKVFQHTNAS